MSRPSEIVHHRFEAQEPDDQYSPEILITGIAPTNLNAAFDVFRTRSGAWGRRTTSGTRRRHANSRSPGSLTRLRSSYLAKARSFMCSFTGSRRQMRTFRS
jgi:hypothetical protein